ncbi:glycine N-acyltransferase-like protein 3 [Turdus rufiventris]|nr:glycine N-acyltransferase-like protein 3 [Turdus rufiventris]
MTVARGNPASHEVLVDSWPHFSIVLTRLRPEVLPQAHKDPRDYYTNQLSVFYRDKGALQALLQGTEAVTQGRAFQILGMQDGLDEDVQEVASAKGLKVETIRYLVLMSPEPPQPRRQMPPGLRLAPVSPSHIPLLNATWALGGNARSRAFLLGLVQTLPSACLLDQRGRPVSWSLLDGQGCLRHGYTVPAWRGRGLTGIPLAVLGRDLHARGFPVYGAVLPHNKASLRALQAIGFVLQPGTFYMILGTPK